MAAVLLDSTAVIDILRGRPAAAARFVELQSVGDVPYVCAVTAEEVSAFLRPREREAAMTINARLIKGNPKDFPMSKLLVEHWPAGE